ncbi:hypothetical protein BCR33DRAFT_720417 [Rhizoclosmatium globosum]|uniref:Uncharacterized protein n=1 Tax=Rhizoclosmatium globosum TaxID=329046 RepID=A0A1Y2BWP2_9FUNG|nr:hypothetical protein BCR33DRAFT_720417 [Rhizoclosmatium globosum]|eukprot:ORY39182.1 hypothetical protein BCR33DRAFT_720417 [Rhizoclosmatium globosum]
MTSANAPITPHHPSSTNRDSSPPPSPTEIAHLESLAYTKAQQDRIRLTQSHTKILSDMRRDLITNPPKHRFGFTRGRFYARSSMSMATRYERPRNDGDTLLSSDSATRRTLQATESLDRHDVQRQRDISRQIVYYDREACQRYIRAVLNTQPVHVRQRAMQRRFNLQ